jgi:ABC-type lipoprotein release transport system permease subunit
LSAEPVARKIGRLPLYGVSNSDGLTFAGVAVLVLLTAIVASWIPVARAACGDPVEVLREE